MPTSPLHGLFCQLFWGREPAEARSFGPEVESVQAAPDERAPLPLYGFTLDAEPFLLARRTASGYRVFVPPQAQVARGERGALPHPVAREQLPREDGRPYVDLEAGGALDLTEGRLRLRVQPSVPAGARERRGLRAAVVVVAAAVGTLTLPIGFLFSRATQEDADRLSERAFQKRSEHEERVRRELEARYPTSIQTDAGVPDGRERVKLPTHLSVE